MDTLLSVIDFDYPFCDAREKTMYYHVLYWDYLHREGVFLRPQSEDTGELTTVINPASITRMASSHPDNRETTMYGRHGKHDGKPPKIKRSRTKTDKPKHPIEQGHAIRHARRKYCCLGWNGVASLVHAGFGTRGYDCPTYSDWLDWCGGGFRRHSGLDIFRPLASEFM